MTAARGSGAGTGTSAGRVEQAWCTVVDASCREDTTAAHFGPAHRSAGPHAPADHRRPGSPPQRRDGSRESPITPTHLESPSTAAAASATSPAAPVWRAADDDLWVGTVDGEYAGLIARHPDGYHAHDRLTRPVGVAPTFDRATCLLAPAAPAPRRARRTSTLHRPRPAGRGNRLRSSLPAGTTKEDTMATGTVKWFNAEKGFGFIAPSDGSADVFAHYSAIASSGFRTLEENQQVEFEVTQGPKGLQASDIRPL